MGGMKPLLPRNAAASLLCSAESAEFPSFDQTVFWMPWVPIDFSFSAMAARSDQNPARWRRPFIAWLEGIESGWAIPLLLAGFVAIWMVFLTVAYLGGGLHPDTLETWTLGRSFAWGNPKHPPLMGWVARIWTT